MVPKITEKEIRKKSRIEHGNGTTEISIQNPRRIIKVSAAHKKELKEKKDKQIPYNSLSHKRDIPTRSFQCFGKNNILHNKFANTSTFQKQWNTLDSDYKKSGPSAV